MRTQSNSAAIEVVRRIYVQRGSPLSEVCLASGCCRATVHNFMTGRKVSPQSMWKIMQALDIALIQIAAYCDIILLAGLIEASGRSDKGREALIKLIENEA